MDFLYTSELRPACVRPQISGYDSCAHLSEETKRADRNAAWGILLAVSISVVLGLGYIIALLFSIQVPDRVGPQRWHARQQQYSPPLSHALPASAVCAGR